MERTRRRRENVFTPIAEWTLTGGIVGAAYGGIRGALFKTVPVEHAVIGNAAKAFAFSGVYYSCRSVICAYKGEKNLKDASTSTHAMSGAVTGGLYATFNKGITRFPASAALGSVMGSVWCLVCKTVQHWKEKERRRLEWTLEHGSEEGFRAQEERENRPSPTWLVLTSLPSWFPIQFHDQNNASDERTDLKVKEQLAETYGDFSTPTIGVERDEERSRTRVDGRRKNGLIRMHRPNTGGSGESGGKL